MPRRGLGPPTQIRTQGYLFRAGLQLQPTLCTLPWLPPLKAGPHPSVPHDTSKLLAGLESDTGPRQFLLPPLGAGVSGALSLDMAVKGSPGGWEAGHPWQSTRAGGGPSLLKDPQKLTDSGPASFTAVGPQARARRAGGRSVFR